MGILHSGHGSVGYRRPRWGWRRWQAWFGLWFLVGAYFALGRGPAPGSPEVPVVALWRSDVGQLVEMSVEEYLVGVVAAEMPARFHPEALKAQAVAARSYTLRALAQGRRDPHHPGAHFSTSPANGQAWVSAEEMRERWGGWEEFRTYWRRIVDAVEATRGEVLVHGGEIVEALYHSTSGGHTESAEDYFRAGKPYLQGVPDPYAAHSPHWRRQVQIPRQEVYRALGVAGGEIEVLARTGSGRVRTVGLGGRQFSGREVREKLGLPSNWFEVEEQGDYVLLRVQGNGHGVGMSQYGADGMARAGFTYGEILAHYYRGAVLTKVY